MKNELVTIETYFQIKFNTCLSMIITVKSKNNVSKLLFKEKKYYIYI